MTDTLKQQLIKQETELFHKSTLMANKLNETYSGACAAELIHIFSSFRTLINEILDQEQNQSEVNDLLRDRLKLWEGRVNYNCPECHNPNCRFIYNNRFITKTCPHCGWSTKIN